MTNKSLKIMTTLICAFTMASCEKLDTSDPGETADNIPLEYGRFVAAVPTGQFETILWFEQEDQTIVGVKVNWSRELIAREPIRLERE